MGAIFSAFGIDWRLLIVNTVNFAIVLGALSYFLYTPLMRMLEERRQKVAQGVADADEAHRRLEEIEAARADKLAQAGKEADEVLAHARRSASEKERATIAQGEAAAARLLDEARLQAREAKERALQESRQELAKLVVLGVEKALVEEK
jgi:F-type H+-transporting ATPase subunit b